MDSAHNDAGLMAAQRTELKKPELPEWKIVNEQQQKQQGLEMPASRYKSKSSRTGFEAIN